MTLEELRARIDAIDAELIRLFSDRMNVAAEIAAGTGPDSQVTGVECCGVFREAGKTVYAILRTYEEDGGSIAQETLLVVPGERRVQGGRFPGFTREP